MGNKTSLPGPDESVTLTPRIDYLEANRVTLSSAQVLISAQMADVSSAAYTAATNLSALDAKSPGLILSISSNSSKLSALDIVSLTAQYNVISTTYYKVGTNAYDVNIRRSLAESVISNVNVVDLSSQIYNTSTNVSNIGVKKTQLQTLFDTVNAKWAPLDTLRSNVNLSATNVITLRNTLNSDVFYQSATVATMSSDVLSKSNSVSANYVSANSFMSYTNFTFGNAYSSRTAQTNTDLVTLQTNATDLSSRVSTAVSYIGLSVNAEITGLGSLITNPSKVYVLDSTTQTTGMFISSGMHGGIIYTNTLSCLWFGVNLPVGTVYSSQPLSTNCGDFTFTSNNNNTIASSSIVKSYYPTGLCFTVVYTGTAAIPVGLVTFKYLYQNSTYNAAKFTYTTTWTVTSCDWFMYGASTGTTAQTRSAESTGVWRGGQVLFTVVDYGTTRRCAVANT